MTFVALTFFVAVVNLGIGYGLAVFLGLGPPTLLDAWDALTARRPGADAAADEALVERLAARGIEALADDLADDAEDIEPFDEPYDDDAAELFHPDDPENWDLNEKYVETSILKLNIAMLKSGARTQEIDTRLRAAVGRSDADTIRRCLADLREDCETYLQQQREAAEKFTARIGELGELRSLGEEIEMANLEQSAQIETTLSNLRHMDFESDLEAANHRLLEEIHNLRTARHRLRDNQEAAFLAVARYEGRLDAVEKQLLNDPLTRLRNRIGLETALQEWWKQGRHQSRQITGLLVDLDAFGKVNEKHGSLVADRLLAQLATLVHKAFAPGDLVGRFGGGSFLAMTTGAGPRAATKNAELLRQSVEKTVFRHGEERIRVTVTGALTEAKPDDSDEGFLKRLADALREAKHAGRNHLFFHDGRKAEPVEAPNLGAKETEVVI